MKNVFCNLIFILLLGVYCQQILAQDQPDVRDKAIRVYSEFNYSMAADIYLELTKVKKPYLKDMEALADCYAKMNQYKDAEIWYERIVKQENSNSENLIIYGRILKANANYKKAKEIFNQYAKKTNKPQLVINDIAGCDSALIWLSKPSSCTVKNQAEINTNRAEFYTWPLNGGKSVYFMGEPDLDNKEIKYGWTGNSYLRLFNANRMDNDSLSKPVLATLNVNDVNYHVGPIISNKSNDILFITHTYTGKASKQLKKEDHSYYYRRLELFIQSKVAGAFTDPIPFVHNNIKEYSVGHAALSADEKVLYFISDMPGGYGGTDIWFCELQKNGTWGKFFNAGKEINSSRNEFFPFIASDKTLYFSSEGWPGMGGLDVFKTNGDKNQWSKPINLGYPLNSAGDDFALYTDNKLQSGYISSNRENGKGSDDIYSFKFKMIKKLTKLTGKTIDKKSKNSLPGVSVVLFDEKSNIVVQKQSAPDGKFSFDIDNTKTYKLLGSKSNFLNDSILVLAQDNDSLEALLQLETIFVKGKVFKLKNILYEYNKAEIRADAAIILNELVQILHENPKLKIELGSHTDARGATKYNADLSQLRAQSAVDYIVSRGIVRSRLTAKGYGESQLVNRCVNGIECTKEEHQQNRRTEFKVLEN